jgi:cellulose synthase/poly-beta-1,6-N-acetylglucosamine synthase-like glycosyltransferase
MTAIFLAFHIVGVGGLALYGLLGFVTLWLFIRNRHTDLTLPSVPLEELPTITIQLPLFNEREVVQRLIEAAASLDYPRDRLQIQVLDDSTDDTTKLAADCVARLRLEGLDVCLRHRDHRRGFKAGALQEALSSARGEFVAIFDADFVPNPDFLLRTIPYLVADATIGVVQARWGHLNSDQSLLTGAQAIALDKHFAIEQFVRYRAEYFPKFNGSAGIWRRVCIVDAGGWHEDTVCEDLCLSTRASLAGWRFHFADDVVAPAELPSTILAYKNQQARWAQGATQCLLKYAQLIWQSGRHSKASRLYALLSMAAYSTHLMLLVVLLVQLPLLMKGERLPSWLPLLGLLGLGQPILFALAQQTLHSDWSYRLRYLPPLFLIAIGTAPSNAWAVLRAFSRRGFIFTRTPKGYKHSYPLATDRMLFVEIGSLIYLLVALYLAVATQNTGPIVFLASSLLGLGYVVLMSITENR